VSSIEDAPSKTRGILLSHNRQLCRPSLDGELDQLEVEWLARCGKCLRNLVIDIDKRTTTRRNGLNGLPVMYSTRYSRVR